jgi:hypothetical protein
MKARSPVEIRPGIANGNKIRQNSETADCNRRKLTDTFLSSLIAVLVYLLALKANTQILSFRRWRKLPDLVCDTNFYGLVARKENVLVVEGIPLFLGPV